MNSSPVWEQWDGPAGALWVHDSGIQRPAGSSGGLVVVAHGLPADKGPEELIPSSLVALSDRLAGISGWRVVGCCLRGVGGSEGDFSLQGWLEDLRAVVSRASLTAPGGWSWMIGGDASGALAMHIAATDTKVRGVACLSSPATFADWASDPSRVASYAREVGIITTAGEPSDLSAWSRPFREIDPLEDVRHLKGRPVLIMHGSDDDVVPVQDARMLAEASATPESGSGPGSVELRILAGAGHRLNSDPRAIALLVGWLERQRT